MVEFEQIEPGIYAYRWIDQITMAEALTAFERLKQIHDGQPYVAIVNMQQLKVLPADIGHMRALIKAELTQGLRGYVLFGASRIVESLVRPLALIAPTTYHFTQDWDQAIQIAHDLLSDGSDI